MFVYFLPWTSHRHLLMSVLRSRQILIFVPKSEFIVINWNILNFLICRAYEDYKKAFYAGDDGRPDWIARKSWNYMIATVEVSQFEFHILLFSKGHLSQEQNFMNISSFKRYKLMHKFKNIKFRISKKNCSQFYYISKGCKISSKFVKIFIPPFKQKVPKEFSQIMHRYIWKE